jgi:nicotinate-nucleotide pyrophosphorylase (carboxylating)
MDELLYLALREDLGFDEGKNNFTDGASLVDLDITTNASINPHLLGNAVIVAREDGILSGQDVAERVFSLLDPALTYTRKIFDGEVITSGTILATIYGSFRSILVGERTALNFLQRLSGVATITNKVVSLVSPYGVKVLDTRKTTPGFRLLEKAAVKAGGGSNHRMGLYDEFLIKNNHIDALGGDVAEAVRRCKVYRPDARLKVEVRDWNEIMAAVSESPDGLLLDNFEAAELFDIIPRVKSLSGAEHLSLEASGGITMTNVEEYAKAGIHEVSLGFLTHSVSSLDISLRYVDPSDALP